jgi:hypothetical protein
VVDNFTGASGEILWTDAEKRGRAISIEEHQKKVQDLERYGTVND